MVLVLWAEVEILISFVMHHQLHLLALDLKNRSVDFYLDIKPLSERIETLFFDMQVWRFSTAISACSHHLVLKCSFQVNWFCLFACCDGSFVVLMKLLLVDMVGL
jgi:hypothetical protein